jgi:hypothetical protein
VGLVGDKIAHKISEILVDLPIEDIQTYLYDFTNFKAKVFEAVNLLAQNENQEADSIYDK